MNIVYVNWKCFGSEDMVAALIKLGHSVNIIELSEDALVGLDECFCNRLCACIKENMAKLVVSFNYYPSISAACMKTGCRYFAWIYDSPYIKAYDATITNNVNFVGTFDSYMSEELNKKGVNTIHYLPLAVNTARMERTVKTYKASQKGRKYESQIEFVGSLYNDRNKFYERLFDASRDMELIGYLDGIIEAQRKIYGYNFLDECLGDDITARIRQFMPYNVPEDSYISEQRVYADYYLGPRIAFLDRRELLEKLAEYYRVVYYSGSNYQIGSAINAGKVDYFLEMPVVFNQSDINLNISLRSIRTGIPLRAMDIMGAGGFLLTNYQSDMLRHFEPEKHFVYYTSAEEAIDKAGYYLQHESERKRMAQAAYEEMEKNHTYEVRLKNVIEQCI